MDLLRSLRNGAAAGAVAGLLTGAFGYLLAEPAIDRSVQLETAREAAVQTRQGAPGLTVEHHAEVFSRGTQHLGLVVAAVATGIALGVLFGVLHALLHRDRSDHNPWRSSLWLAASAFFAVYLVPFVRYPANPPGVGDPNTIDTRTRAYLAALAVGILGVIAAARLASDVRERLSEPLRHLAVTGILLATIGLTFVLPANTDPLDVPAGLLWEFRLLAFASSVLLWGALGITYGLLSGSGTGSPARSSDASSLTV